MMSFKKLGPTQTDRSNVQELPPELLWCSIDYEWLPISHFRVLGCGHYFCIHCLKECEAQEILICPKCRNSNMGNVDELCNIQNYAGQIFLEDPPDEDVSPEMQVMLYRQMLIRSQTIKHLRASCEVLSALEIKAAGAKVGGSAVGLAGSIMVIAGTVLSLTGIGAVVGLPLAISGAVVGAAGGVTVGGGIIAEATKKNTCLKEARKHWDKDFFHSVQLRVLIGRAAQGGTIASHLKLPTQDAVSLFGLLGRLAKVGTITTTSLVARGAAYGVARGAASVGLHIAGLLVSAAMIPVDLGQLIISSMKIHKKSKSAIVGDLERLALELEAELWALLHDQEYTILDVEAIDLCGKPHWLIVAVPKSEKRHALQFLSRPFILLSDIEPKYIILVDSLGKPVAQATYDSLFRIWSVDEVAMNDVEMEQFQLESSSSGSSLSPSWGSLQTDF